MAAERPIIRAEVDSLVPKFSTKGGRNLFLFGDVEDEKICYDAIYGPEPANVLVLPYLYSPKNQGIASQVESWCRKTGCTYVCADYHGVSKSGGRTDSGTISRWTTDTIRLLETVTSGKTILVGAAVGAWVMLRVALARPDLVAGLVGVSVDPDFTEELLWANLSEVDKEAIMDQGIHNIQWGDNMYEISRNLIVDGRENLVLQGGEGSLDITCPVRLLHGTDDEEVPMATALRVMDAVQTTDVDVTILKGMHHFIESGKEFATLRKQLDSVLDAAKLYEYDLKTPGSG